MLLLLLSHSHLPLVVDGVVRVRGICVDSTTGTYICTGGVFCFSLVVVTVILCEIADYSDDVLLLFPSKSLHTVRSHFRWIRGVAGRMVTDCVVFYAYNNDMWWDGACSSIS